MKGSHYLLMQLKISNRRGLFLLFLNSPTPFSVNSDWKIQCPDELPPLFSIQNAESSDLKNRMLNIINTHSSTVLIQHGMHQNIYLHWHRLMHIFFRKIYICIRIPQKPQIVSKLTLNIFKPSQENEMAACLLENSRVGNSYTNTKCKKKKNKPLNPSMQKIKGHWNLLFSNGH